MVQTMRLIASITLLLAMISIHHGRWEGSSYGARLGAWILLVLALMWCCVELDKLSQWWYSLKEQEKEE